MTVNHEKTCFGSKTLSAKTLCDSSTGEHLVEVQAYAGSTPACKENSVLHRRFLQSESKLKGRPAQAGFRPEPSGHGATDRMGWMPETIL